MAVTPGRVLFVLAIVTCWFVPGTSVKVWETSQGLDTNIPEGVVQPRDEAFIAAAGSDTVNDWDSLTKPEEWVDDEYNIEEAEHIEEILSEGTQSSVTDNVPLLRQWNCDLDMCFGQGLCPLLEGLCYCLPGFTGVSCHERAETLPEDTWEIGVAQCSGRGLRVPPSRCVCESGYSGTRCQTGKASVCPINGYIFAEDQIIRHIRVKELLEPSKSRECSWVVIGNTNHVNSSVRLMVDIMFPPGVELSVLTVPEGETGSANIQTLAHMTGQNTSGVIECSSQCMVRLHATPSAEQGIMALEVMIARGSDMPCRNNCSQHGTCTWSGCQCTPPYEGLSCSHVLSTSGRLKSSEATREELDALERLFAFAPEIVNPCTDSSFVGCEDGHVVGIHYQPKKFATTTRIRDVDEALALLSHLQYLELHGVTVDLSKVSLVDLSSLKFIRLVQCNITTPQNLVVSQLHTLQLEESRILGNDSFSWGAIQGTSHLRHLHLENSLFPVFIPVPFASLFPDLESFVLDGGGHAETALGQFPETFSTSSKLRFLSICHTHLRGTINSHSLEELAALEDLLLDDNTYLSPGPLPEAPRECTLKRIRMANSQRIGDIPASWSRCTHLESIELPHNNLSTTHPQAWAFWDFPLLTRLDLSYNDFSGEIPFQRVLNASKGVLDIFNVQHNRFSGAILGSFSRQVKRLILSDNEFTSIDGDLTLSRAGENIRVKNARTRITVDRAGGVDVVDDESAFPTVGCRERFKSGIFGNVPILGVIGVHCDASCYSISQDSTSGWDVKGVDVFMEDSSVCMAALFVGAIGPDGGDVLVQALGRRESYGNTSLWSHGIHSNTHSGWERSFRFLMGTVTQQSWKERFENVRQVAFQCNSVGYGFPESDTGDILEVECPDCREYHARLPYHVTGNIFYAPSSSICAAAIHAGAIGWEGGKFYIQKDVGRLMFRGGVGGGGVQSYQYGLYPDSFRVLGADLKGLHPASWNSSHVLEGPQNSILLRNNKISGVLGLTEEPGSSTLLLALDVSHNAFTGRFPLSHVKHAISVDASFNELDSTDEGYLGEDREVLSVLNLSHNRLHGQVPQISRSLSKVDLSFNSFSYIPTDLLMSPDTLKVFSELSVDLQGCGISGKIPDVLGEVTSADIRDNNLYCDCGPAMMGLSLGHCVAPSWVPQGVCKEVVVNKISPTSGVTDRTTRVTVTGRNFGGELNAAAEGQFVLTRVLSSTMLTVDVPAGEDREVIITFLSMGRASDGTEVDFISVSRSHATFRRISNCSPGTYLDRTSKSCLKCPLGANCVGGLAEPVAARGFYKSGSVYTPCLVYDSCIGDNDCAEGYTGPYCASCAAGFYRLSGECHACGSFGDAQVFIVLTIFVGVILFMLAVARRLFRYIGPLTIGISFLQILSFLSRMSLDWPGTVKSTYTGFSWTNFNAEFFATECKWDIGFEARYIGQLVFPVFILLLYTVTFIVINVWNRIRGKHFNPVLVDRYINIGLLVLSIAYLFLAASVFELVDCTKHEKGASTLDADPLLECYSEWWWRLFPLFVVGCLVYVVGIPALFLWIILYYRDRLDEEMVKRRYGFLFTKYKRKRPYWEVVILLRKLSVVMASLLIGRYPMSQAAIVGAVLVVSLFIQQLCKPFGKAHHNRLEAALLVSLCLIVFLGQVFYGESSDLVTRAKPVLIASLMVVIIVSVLLIVIYGFVDIRQLHRQRRVVVPVTEEEEDEKTAALVGRRRANAILDTFREPEFSEEY